MLCPDIRGRNRKPGKCDVGEDHGQFCGVSDYAKTDYIYIEAGYMAEGERTDTLTCDLVEYGILTPVCYENGNVLARVDVHGEKTEESEEKLVEFKQNRRLQQP